ncbi:Fe2+ transport system protein FeoA [Caldicoprobacter guelmensis]|uniref:FeoA family protein n=1 Tax=Caldicoprobacter guelmensis TaxID=1170224 RepID=UPI00195C4069|nr:ferrous iron transport protein A [Caldicoprobacter guelmensis]MBM7581922.1 Fe2+ transport system protein FeoA [Caldicoprobacter guelmensis]
MTLDQVNKGQKFQIVLIPDKHISAQAIRLGIHEGAILTCVYKFPAGPVVIQNGMQEIAIGRGLASKIQVKLLDKGDAKKCSATI